MFLLLLGHACFMAVWIAQSDVNRISNLTSMDCSQSVGLNLDLVWPHTAIDTSRHICLIRAVVRYSQMYIQIELGLAMISVIGLLNLFTIENKKN